MDKQRRSGAHINLDLLDILDMYFCLPFGRFFVGEKNTNSTDLEDPGMFPCFCCASLRFTKANNPKKMLPSQFWGANNWRM